MWADTRMEQLSTDVAPNFGRVALLAGDITTADPRYNTLPWADRLSVLKDAFTSLHALESVDARSPSPVVAECGHVLAEEFADVSASNTASTR